jgi:hypothetical protein
MADSVRTKSFINGTLSLLGQVLTAVRVNSSVFRDVTQCTDVSEITYRPRFRARM